MKYYTCTADKNHFPNSYCIYAKLSSIIQVSNEKFNINTNQLEEVISEQKEELVASKKKIAVCVICTHICGHSYLCTSIDRKLKVTLQ